MDNKVLKMGFRQRVNYIAVAIYENTTPRTDKIINQSVIDGIEEAVTRYLEEQEHKDREVEKLMLQTS